MSVRTVMSALRPCMSRSAISPKWSPGPRRRCRPSTVLTSAWPSRMTMNPTPSLPLRTGLAPFGWRTSRICLPSFFRSPSDISANRPTGFRSIARDSIRLKDVRQVAPEQLRAGRLLVRRNKPLHSVVSQLGQSHAILAGNRDHRADEHLQGLAEPHVLATRKPDRYYRHACLDG